MAFNNFMVYVLIGEKFDCDTFDLSWHETILIGEQTRFITDIQQSPLRQQSGYLYTKLNRKKQESERLADMHNDVRRRQTPSAWRSGQRCHRCRRAKKGTARDTPALAISVGGVAVVLHANVHEAGNKNVVTIRPVVADADLAVIRNDPHVKTP